MQLLTHLWYISISYHRCQGICCIID